MAVLVARNEWSVGNKAESADVNQLWMNYLLFYNLPKLFYLAYEPLITANWEGSLGDRSDPPRRDRLDGLIKTPKRPRLGMTSRCSGFYNAVRPDNGASWQLVATFGASLNPNRAVFDF